jgi:hypothetical protein
MRRSDATCRNNIEAVPNVCFRCALAKPAFRSCPELSFELSTSSLPMVRSTSVRYCCTRLGCRRLQMPPMRRRQAAASSQERTHGIDDSPLEIRDRLELADSGHPPCGIAPAAQRELSMSQLAENVQGVVVPGAAIGSPKRRPRQCWPRWRHSNRNTGEPRARN